MSDIFSFGQWIKRRRKALDLTQDALAQQVGCSTALIVKIEADARRPSLQVAQRLAQQLGLAADERSAFLQAARAKLGVDRLAPPTHSVPQMVLAPAAALPFGAVTVPPLQTPAGNRTNLLAQLTALIGRERERADVVALLRRADVRLVTLTGTGGVGKTRLGTSVAAELLDEFADGVWFVNLAPIDNPELVTLAIAQALDVREAGRLPLRELLKRFLSERQLLLLLDNFEQVIDARLLVAELLSAAPRLRVLVTSRAVLRVSGEREYVVPPLALPDWQRLLPPEQLTDYDAVRLFVERACAVKADFAVTHANAPAVAEICARLDGLPLAIELAAARSKLFPPEALLARLRRRLVILTGGARDLPARQQTLRNTIDWSFRLLMPQEQQLFRRLAVFVGGCSLEAVQTICNLDDAQDIDTLDGLEALIDQSLLKQAAGLNGESRLYLLETIREYALERLEASGEKEALERKHAAYFLAIAERGEMALHSSMEAEWLQTLAAEDDNLRAALTWALADTRAQRSAAEATERPATTGYASLPTPQAMLTPVELGVRLAGAMGSFWLIHGPLGEARQWLTIAEASAPLATPEQRAAHAKILTIAGTVAYRQGDLTTARSLLDESLATYQALGQKLGLAQALYSLFLVITQQQQYDEAQPLIEASLAWYRELHNQPGIAEALIMLGFCASGRSDFARARPLFEESLAVSRRIGDKRGIATAQYWIASVLDDGDNRQPTTLLEEALAAYRELGDTWGIMRTLIFLGELALGAGQHVKALAWLEPGLAAAQDLDYVYNAKALRCLGGAVWQQGDAARALGLYRSSLRMYWDIEDRWGITECLEGLAEVFSGQMAGAAIASSLDMHPIMLRAAQLYGAAAALRESTGNPVSLADRARCECAVAALTAELGETVFSAAWEAGRTLPLEQVVAGELTPGGPA